MTFGALPLQPALTFSGPDFLLCFVAAGRPHRPWSHPSFRGCSAVCLLCQQPPFVQKQTKKVAFLFIIILWFWIFWLVLEVKGVAVSGFGLNCFVKGPVQ